MNSLSLILGEWLAIFMAITIMILVMAIYYTIFCPWLLVCSVLINGSFRLGWHSCMGQAKRTKEWLVQGWFV